MVKTMGAVFEYIVLITFICVCILGFVYINDIFESQVGNTSYVNISNITSTCNSWENVTLCVPKATNQSIKCFNICKENYKELSIEKCYTTCYNCSITAMCVNSTYGYGG